MITCPIHDTEVEIDRSRGVYVGGWCSKDGGHLVEVQAV